MFDSGGRRIAEYVEVTGALIREYVWNGWEPVAVVEGGVVTFVRADHIGRPVFATNTSGVKVWSATYLTFGGVHVSTGSAPANRFPGQWFQSESGLHQNWMRDYDPTTGRYLEADPLGLVDGASVYGYVRGNPGRFTDPQGLELRLYTSGRAFGLPIFNHAFIYGTECDCFAGTGGASPSQDTENGGNRDGRPYVVIPLPAGMTEREFRDKLKGYLNWGYFPGIWDCHSQMWFAFYMMGLEYPGAPNGRLELDNTIANAVEGAFNNKYNLAPSGEGFIFEFMR